MWCNTSVLFGAMALVLGHATATAQSSAAPLAADGPGLNGLTTNGPAVYRISAVPSNTNNNAATEPPSRPANPGERIFSHFVPESLNNLIWTNVIAQTNGRNTSILAERGHSANWPRTGPLVRWSTNGLMWGLKGLTALSPCWEGEGNPGQVPITALTRRHGYARGHEMGPPGFQKDKIPRAVWFLAADNTLISRTVSRRVVRTRNGGDNDDYTIFLLNKDLPDSIQPMRVAEPNLVVKKYPSCPGAPWPLFLTEQTGHVSAEIPGFRVPTWKGGDSGSPNMLPMPGELVFFGGRSTSGPTDKMQKDMDELCRLEKLDPKKYQMRWVTFSEFPSY